MELEIITVEKAKNMSIFTLRFVAGIYHFERLLEAKSIPFQIEKKCRIVVENSSKSPVSCVSVKMLLASRGVTKVTKLKFNQSG